MLLIRRHHQAGAGHAIGAMSQVGPALAHPEPPLVQLEQTLEQTIQDLHAAGHSQRSIARDLSIGRRKVKQIIDMLMLEVTPGDQALM